VVVKATDGFEERFEIVFDVLIGDPEDAVAEGFQVGIPVQVVGDLSLFFMDGTVEFKDKPQLVTEEVGDIGTDRSLTAEFEAKKPAASKMGPENLLGRGGISSELSGTECGVFIGEAHGKIILGRGIRFSAKGTVIGRCASRKFTRWVLKPLSPGGRGGGWERGVGE
jgi:hypothetical protein